MPKFKKNPSPIMKNMEYWKNKFAESEAKYVSPVKYVGYEDLQMGDAYAGEEKEFNPRMEDYGYDPYEESADDMAGNLERSRKRTYIKQKVRRERGRG